MLKFINADLQSAYDNRDFTRLMAAADAVKHCGSKLPATREGGVVLFENGMLLITQDEQKQCVEKRTAIGSDWSHSHRTVAVNKPLRGLYPQSALLVAQS
jgi:hypothetical protein